MNKFTQSETNLKIVNNFLTGSQITIVFRNLSLPIGLETLFNNSLTEVRRNFQIRV